MTPLFSRYDFPAVSVTSIAMNLALLGDLMWIVTYVFIITIGFRQRTYGIPVAALCMNITWELIYTAVIPCGQPPCETDEIMNLSFLMRVVWLLLDGVILVQILVFGKKEQTVNAIRRRFRAIVAGGLILSFIGQLTFHQTYYSPLSGTHEMVLNGFINNLVMSILFVNLFVSRPEQRGLSYGAAWAKMLGTGLISVANAILFIAQKELRDALFWIFLFTTIFLFDAVYVILLARTRRKSPSAANPRRPEKACA